MSEFVDECRREWRRLRVPEPVANEMAADLAADLREAEDDGASPEELLGNEAFNPSAFATRWARERGLLTPRLRDRLRRPTVIAAVVGTALAIIAAAIAAVVLVGFSDSSSTSGPAQTDTSAAPVTTVLKLAVPDLLGLTQAEASARAQALGLRLEIQHANAAGAKRGFVVQQSPAAGNSVSRGATLTLVVGR